VLPGDIELHLVDNIDAAYAMKRWLSEDRGREVLGLDTETTGLTWLKPGDGLRLVQIGDHHTGWAVPWDQWGGAVMECLNAWEGDIALHNLAFDTKFLKTFAGWKPPWHRLHDTMLMSRIMLPGQPAGLKPLSVKLIDPRSDAGAAQLKAAMSSEGWTWATIPVDYKPFWAYGALDPILTAHLWSYFRADQHFPEVYDLEMATLRVCSEMEERGINIDVDYCARKERELGEYVETMKKWGQSELGLSLGSSAQLVRYFQSVGAQITMRTPSGAPSCNAEQLEIFLEHPDPKVSTVAKAALDMRKADKLRGTYFENLINDNVGGIIHPSINTMGAITGRMSCSNPNLQNLPSNSPTVKNAFIPSEGNVILSSDLDQVEFRLFACYSGDEGLQNTFRRADENKSDAFTEIGRELYSDPDMKKSDPRRALIKTYIYAKLFGASTEKQAKSAGVSVSTMKEFADTITARYPGMETFQRSLIDTVQKRERDEKGGYIITPTTKRRLPVERDKAYKAVNYVIQSSAADVFKRNLVKIDAAGLGELLRVPVHDEIIMDVPRQDYDEVAHIVQGCMTTVEGWAVPLTGDISGPYTSWGKKYEK
jgi:DNA polymerase-1